MACSMLDNEIPITTVEDTNSVDMVSYLTETHQMELLTQNFDNISMNSCSNVRISYTEIDSGRIVVDSSESISSSPSEENINKYLSLHLPLRPKEQVTKLPGYHKSFDDASSHISDCVFCREERL